MQWCGVGVQFGISCEGRRTKLLNLIDDFTSECLAIEFYSSVYADPVVTIVVQAGGRPVFVGFDS